MEAWQNQVPVSEWQSMETESGVGEEMTGPRRTWAVTTSHALTVFQDRDKCFLASQLQLPLKVLLNL